ncbi:MAG: RNA helicase [Spirochaetae bacterium HGW-Spirochaetae-1]|jgi:ATP-dependent RNA helicase DeaD|nr:MAG: RNA helicase [Spirochaetae bacterium HGW-Spirochaetae-1]
MKLNEFRQLGLSEKSLLEIDKKGFEEPTEIQKKTIPLLLSSTVDVIGQAQTGTGKTAAFGLPIIEMIKEHSKSVQALILVPTRELAIQVSEEINSFKGGKKIQILPIYGGQSMMDQIRRLEKGVDIVVGTPGRVADHLKRKTLSLDKISIAVLDEADEMLNMGFIDEVESILAFTNPDKRMLLFSATMPTHIMNIAKKYMHEYEFIAIKKDALTENLTDQIYFEVSPSDKFESLCRIIDIEDEFYGLVFCRTKVAVDELANRLADRGYNAEGIHGDFSQHQRELTLSKFKKKRTNILVATDVAARGIDISNLSHVINFSLPQDPEAYIHRIGRTGRAGKKGVAITFISPSERRKLNEIVKLTKSTINKKIIPSVDEIINAKKTKLAADLSATIEQGNHSNYVGPAMQLLKGNDPIEIIAALLHYSFQDELDRNNYNEISPIVKENKEHVRLFVSMGKKDGLTAKKLVHMIQNESRVKAGRINEVTVKDTFSFFSVPFDEADVIIDAFKKQRRKNIPMIHKASKEKEKERPKRKKKTA